MVYYFYKEQENTSKLAESQSEKEIRLAEIEAMKSVLCHSVKMESQSQLQAIRLYLALAQLPKEMRGSTEDIIDASYTDVSTNPKKLPPSNNDSLPKLPPASQSTSNENHPVEILEDIIDRLSTKTEKVNKMIDNSEDTFKTAKEVAGRIMNGVSSLFKFIADNFAEPGVKMIMEVLKKIKDFWAFFS